MLKSPFENCVFAEIVFDRLRVPQHEVGIGARRRRSPSADRVEELGALADVMATNSLGVSRPELTPASHSTAMRSSTPPQPFGILAKLSMPAAFCDAQKVQWSVAVVCSWPLCRPRHRNSWWILGAEGRAHDIGRGLGEVGVAVDAVVDQQMARQHLAVDALATSAGAGDGFGALDAADMHDVDRHAQHVGNRDGTVGGLAFHHRRARHRMALGAGDAHLGHLCCSR
jgi:hypothetical protein